MQNSCPDDVILHRREFAPRIDNRLHFRRLRNAAIYFAFIDTDRDY